MFINSKIINNIPQLKEKISKVSARYNTLLQNLKEKKDSNKLEDKDILIPQNKSDNDEDQLIDPDDPNLGIDDSLGLGKNSSTRRSSPKMTQEEIMNIMKKEQKVIGQNENILNSLLQNKFSKGPKDQKQSILTNNNVSRQTSKELQNILNDKIENISSISNEISNTNKNLEIVVTLKNNEQQNLQQEEVEEDFEEVENQNENITQKNDFRNQDNLKTNSIEEIKKGKEQVDEEILIENKEQENIQNIENKQKQNLINDLEKKTLEIESNSLEKSHLIEKNDMKNDKDIDFKNDTKTNRQKLDEFDIEEKKKSDNLEDMSENIIMDKSLEVEIINESEYIEKNKHNNTKRKNKNKDNPQEQMKKNIQKNFTNDAKTPDFRSILTNRKKQREIEEEEKNSPPRISKEEKDEASIFESGFGGGFEDGFDSFDLDNFITKPQNEAQKRLIPKNNLDIKKKIPRLRGFPTFDEFLKNGKLPEIPGIDLPRTMKDIKKSKMSQKELKTKLKGFVQLIRKGKIKPPSLKSISTIK